MYDFMLLDEAILYRIVSNSLQLQILHVKILCSPIFFKNFSCELLVWDIKHK